MFVPFEWSNKCDQRICYCAVLLFWPAYIVCWSVFSHISPIQGRILCQYLSINLPVVCCFSVHMDGMHYLAVLNKHLSPSHPCIHTCIRTCLMDDSYSNWSSYFQPTCLRCNCVCLAIHILSPSYCVRHWLGGAGNCVRKSLVLLMCPL